MTTSPAQHPGRQLTVADRCDRCSARAKVLAVLHSGGQLFFCGHHASAHLPALERQATFFRDQSVPEGQLAAA